jgi:hypothetical protein
MKKDYSTKTLAVMLELTIALFQIIFVSIATFFAKKTFNSFNNFFSESWERNNPFNFKAKLSLGCLILMLSCFSISSFGQSSPSGQVSFVTPTILFVSILPIIKEKKELLILVIYNSL